mmetsp:Transcript_9912/g.15263  ORF Transcript_9912/g.15263 Transcript_9912/m.15263 type:complete len:236 (+) Transcript_9912:100-807(+)|eukprot:CAMPEP_0195294272 /NCGR_PEP_ID=MMETSP0707-20130614/14532_1 /TAXON_ID=33640 /ORGANISM="Asterionellopsis glacialis, Strain CCMP134" /LENGTH=235 /DNA_ID=CAMNT_0040355197 /DNA_START=25 /DNA_END=732 /DNA_ORIENTATION=+
MSFTAIDQAVNVSLVVPRAIDDDLCMPFPQRLMEIISNDENADIISWLPHGKGFHITKKKQFAAEILPRYFKHSSKWTSFTRKLNRWGFTRITSGPEQGSYYHKYFLRDQPRLCHQMHCESGPKFHSFHQIIKMQPGQPMAEHEAPVMQMPAPSHVTPEFMEAAQIAMLKQQLQTRAENNYQVTQDLSQNLYRQLLHGKLGVTKPQTSMKHEYVQHRQANHETSGNGRVRRANAA